MKTRENGSPNDGASGTEKRSVQAEMRIEGEGSERRLVGHAAVFNKLSGPIFGFREKILPGAFTRAIKEGQDVRALWNHDSNLVLGRTKNGTLQLSEDRTGLAVSIDPPDVQWANDMLVSVDRGDVDQMSFQFKTPPGGDAWATEGGELIRSLLDIDLMDVSPATFPAYEQTDLALRGLGFDYDEIQAILIRIEHGIELSTEDRSMLDDYLATLRGYVSEPPAVDTEAVAQGRIDNYRELQRVGDKLYGQVT